jgi:hypothetical protein
MKTFYRNSSIFILLASALFIILFTGQSYNSENPNSMIIKTRTCGTVEFNEMQMRLHPEFRENRKRIEEFTKNYVYPSDAIVATIPVVIHVLYNTPQENISDAQIFSQITVLNQDYARLNPDTNLTPVPFKSLGANVMIQFCLAQRDPSDNPTTGITRTSTSVTQFAPNDPRIFSTAQGGYDIWDRNKYLNIYVCNLGGGLLGFAQFPGGSDTTDAAVILYTAFGTTGTVTPPYDKGRTTTHEVGHWFNLIHIWGDEPNCAQDDEVADTPLQGTSSSGCPTFPFTDACSPTSPGIMFMNYMDYSDDACMNIFTLGQSVRMNAALHGPRASLLTSNGCVPIGITPLGNEIPRDFKLMQNYPNPFNPSTKIGFSVAVESNVKITVYDIKGNLVEQLVNQNMKPGVYNVDWDASKYSSGVYLYKLETGKFSISKKMVLMK